MNRLLFGALEAVPGPNPSESEIRVFFKKLLDFHNKQLNVSTFYGKMEEDGHKDDAGVDGRGVSGWDGWVGGLGAMGVSSIFGLVRRAVVFTGGLMTFPLVSGIQLAEHNCGSFHFFTASFSSKLETIFGGALSRTSTLYVVLGVGGTTIASGSRAPTSHSWTSRLLNSSFSLGVSSLFCRTTQCHTQIGRAFSKNCFIVTQ